MPAVSRRTAAGCYNRVSQGYPDAAYADPQHRPIRRRGRPRLAFELVGVSSGGRRIVGHDGGTIGQLAYLRLDPEAGLAVCLLTNSSVSPALYERLFGEIFEEYVGVRPPVLAQPEHIDVDANLERHTGRYERTSARYDVSLRGGELHVFAQSTGAAALFDEEPHDLTLRPVDPHGTTFLTRAHEDEPWSPIAFLAFPDGSPYLFSGGRVTPKVKVAPVDRADAQAWLDRYVAAWLSYEANDIAALFSDDIAYRYHPHDDPIVGREAVVASWLGEGDSKDASTRATRRARTQHTTNLSQSTAMWLLPRALPLIASDPMVPSFASMTTAS